MNSKNKIYTTLLLIGFMFNYSCNKCIEEDRFYFCKYDLPPNLQVKLEVKLEVNNDVVYDKMNREFVSPTPFEIQKYCSDLCTTNLKDKLIKIQFTVNKKDTLFFLDSSKVKGTFLGYDITSEQLIVAVDSIGKGLYLGNMKIGFE